MPWPLYSEALSLLSDIRSPTLELSSSSCLPAKASLMLLSNRFALTVIPLVSPLGLAVGFELGLGFSLAVGINLRDLNLVLWLVPVWSHAC